MGVLLLFASGQIIIPTKPVPLTLQTVAVVIIGLSHRPGLSFSIVLAYLTIGAGGMPIFSKYNSGIDYLTGTTAGYFLGFLVAVPVISYLRSLGASFWHILGSILAGQIIIYTLGISWLTQIVGFKKAIYSGFIVFIPSGIVKTIILSSMFSYINRKKLSIR